MDPHFLRRSAATGADANQTFGGVGRLFRDVPLDRARELVEVNGAMTQRSIAASSGMEGLGEWLAERFVHGPAA